MAKGEKDKKENFPWKCDVKGCNVKGMSSTKENAQLAKAMHKYLVH